MYENKVVVEFIILIIFVTTTPSARKGGGGNLERGVLVLSVFVSLSPFWLKPKGIRETLAISVFSLRSPSYLSHGSLRRGIEDHGQP